MLIIEKILLSHDQNLVESAKEFAYHGWENFWIIEVKNLFYATKNASFGYDLVESNKYLS